MRKKLQLLLMLAVAAMLLAAGCGDDDDSSSSSSESSSGAETSASSDDSSGDEGDEGADGGEMVLEGVVGPGFDISLTDSSGEPVTELPAGDYTINISDVADNHNFHLMGDNVDESTALVEKEEVSWDLTLEPGEYRFQCDPHAGTMNGKFTVT